MKRGFRVGDKVIHIYNNPLCQHDGLRGGIGVIINVDRELIEVKWNNRFYWWVPNEEIRLAKPEELS